MLYFRSGYRRGARALGFTSSSLGFRLNGVLRPSSRSNMSYVARSGERIGSSVRTDYHGTLGFRLAL